MYHFENPGSSENESKQTYGFKTPYAPPKHQLLDKFDQDLCSMIKNVKELITRPLAHICNSSFTTGVFPSELKLANVAPVYKANDEMVFSNYRPVSVLPVLSKLLERLMYNRLISYINEK